MSIEAIGVDVSYAQGKIDWDTVKASGMIKFVILRLGFGQTGIDDQAERNITELNRLGIPYGIYWFSYAYTTDMARNEAKKVIELLKSFKAKLSYPAYFDYEYHSEEVGNKHTTITGELVKAMTEVFCEELLSAGIYPGIYTNYDYIHRAYGNSIFDKYDLWYAAPESITETVNTPSKDRPSHSAAKMWQFSWTGDIPGISVDVDMNKCFVDYPSIVGNVADIKSLKVINVSATEAKIKLIASEMVAERKWYFLLKELKTGIKTAKKKFTLNKDYEVTFAIKNLNPNNAYELIITAEGDKDDKDDESSVTLPSVIFCTDQVFPEPAKNVSFNKETGIVSFTTPENWATVNSKRTAGYSIVIKVNGIEKLASPITTTAATNTTIKKSVRALIAEADLDYRDDYQIGIITWVKDEFGDYIYTEAGCIYSKTVYIRPAQPEINQVFVKLRDSFNRTIIHVKK